MKSLFNKVAGATLLKKTPTQMFSCEICEIFQNIYFEHLRMTAFCLVEKVSYELQISSL